MKKIITAAAVSLSVSAAAQFAVVQDPDGFTNVRAAAAKGSAVIDTLSNGHLVYCFEKKGNWVSIDYTQKNKEGHGFIYYDRIEQTGSNISIALKSQKENEVVLTKDSVTVFVTRKKFDKTTHRFSYYKDNPSQIEKIDNNRYWGTDGGMPATAYKKITVRTGSKTIVLPERAYKDLFEPNLYTTKAYFDKAKNIIYIQSMNSDGAGGYEVIWKIENGQYKERLVAYGF